MAGSSKDAQLNNLLADFYARFMQVILESRIPVLMPVSHSEDGSTSTSAHRARVPAFNIVLGKFGSIINSMEPWCKVTQKPMVIDILFSRRGNNRVVEGVRQKVVKGAGNLSMQAPAGMAFAESGLEQLVLLERWTVEFCRHSSSSSGKVERGSELQFHKRMVSQRLTGTKTDILRVESTENNRRVVFSGNNEIAAVYNVVEKKMAILLRSTYSTARLLPAQTLFRLLSTSGNCRFKLSYNVVASPSSSDTKDMTQFYFTPIETHGGHLRVSVAHRHKNPSTEYKLYPLCPQIIPDYVGASASCHSKKVPPERTEPTHCRPSSAQRLSSFKFDNLQLYQVPNTGMAKRELEQSRADPMGSLVGDESFECPFAINEEHHDNRMESAEWRLVNLDTGWHEEALINVPGDASEVFGAFQRPAAPLSGAHQPMKDAASSLKELKMYIDIKDCLLK